MDQLRQRNSNISLNFKTPCKATIYQKNSDMVFNSPSHLDSLISPWSQELYYTKIKNNIRREVPQKRAKTAFTLSKKDNIQPRKKRQPTRMKTVHFQLPLHQLYTQSLSNFCSKQFQHRSTIKSTLHDNNTRQRFHSNCLNSKTVISNDDKQPIHYRKSSSKMIKYAKQKVQTKSNQINRDIFYDQNQNCSKLNEKKGLMFFFKAKNSSKIFLRQKMIMKIRNIKH